MPLNYTNRRQETYYVRAAGARKGGVRYYIVKDFTRYPAEEILEAMPEGFEWYEYPEDGKTVLRKIVPTNVPPTMVEMVEDLVYQYSPLEIIQLDVEPDAVTVYEYPHNPDDLGMSAQEIRRFAYMLPVLRFAQLPEQQFQVQRVCKYPGLEGWIPLETGPDLAALVTKFAPHIGQESLLEFWIEGEEDF